MEAERMLHPVINKEGIKTQNEVVKEEKRANFDNSPYAYYQDEVKKNIFDLHPYKRASIGSMEDLDAASLDEFIAFRNQYYVPNNAVLVVAGDIDIDQSKQWIENYFSRIPKGPPVERIAINEAPIEKERKATYYDKNIQIPALITAYRSPEVTNRDAKVLEIISTYLSDGKSSKLYKRMVDKEKIALEVAAFNLNQEDYGVYIILGLPLGGNTFDDLLLAINEEIVKIQEGLISKRDYQKIQNKFETEYVNANASVEGIANSLAEYYAFYRDTKLINEEIDIYRSITREDIRRVARKYLNPQQRLILDYLPTSEKQ